VVPLHPFGETLTETNGLKLHLGFLVPSQVETFTIPDTASKTPEAVELALEAAVREALNTAGAGTDHSIRRAVSDCTHGLKSLGTAPERVLASVKAAVRRAATPWIPETEVLSLVRDAAQRCINAYYDDEPSGH
jgi:hypothetical protein